LILLPPLAQVRDVSLLTLRQAQGEDIDGILMLSLSKHEERGTKFGIVKNGMLV
jgi:hypothetical protein